METAQFLQLVSENTSDFISIFSLNWKYVQVSSSCKNITGYSPDELINHSVHEKMHPEDLNRILSDMTQFNQSFKTQYLTYRFLRKDGSFIWVETLLKRLEIRDSNNYPLALGITKDITTRKNSEDMVKKFVEGVQYASDCIIMANPDGKIMYANPAATILSSYPAEEIIGQHANMFWGGLEDADKIVNMWSILQRLKKPYKSEITNMTKEGKTYFSEVHISPIMDQNKEITFFVGISRDITKAKEIDKMKNEFISLASHQLQTPLTAVKWSIEMLMDETFEKLNDDQKHHVKAINDANIAMIDLVKALLNISRIESGRLIIEPKMTSLEEVMMAAIDDFESKIKEKGIELKLSFQTNVYDVNVDPKLIRNVYSNLLSNAIKYTPDHGKIEVAIYTDNDSLITKIQDSGYGIQQDEQKRVFEKFFRATNIKRVQTEGTGLGLYLVKAIMDASNGKIWFESQEGKGTTFYISLGASGMPTKQGEVSISE